MFKEILEKFGDSAKTIPFTAKTKRFEKIFEKFKKEVEVASEDCVSVQLKEITVDRESGWFIVLFKPRFKNITVNQYVVFQITDKFSKKIEKIGSKVFKDSTVQLENGEGKIIFPIIDNGMLEL